MVFREDSGGTNIFQEESEEKYFPKFILSFGHKGMFSGGVTEGEANRNEEKSSLFLKRGGPK